jgi:hypothetical protein
MEDSSSHCHRLEHLLFQTRRPAFPMNLETILDLPVAPTTKVVLFP